MCVRERERDGDMGGWREDGKDPQRIMANYSGNGKRMRGGGWEMAGRVVTSMQMLITR